MRTWPLITKSLRRLRRYTSAKRALVPRTAAHLPGCKDRAMPSLSDLLTKLIDSDRVTQMAERVAGRSRMGVWQRTMHQLPTLGPTEARGYLRARGISVVHEETLRLIEQEGRAVARHQAEIEEA